MTGAESPTPSSTEPAAPLVAGRRWHFASVILDERTLELRVDGELVALDPKPLAVLQHLLGHAGEVVTREELAEACWPGRILSETVLAKCMSRLRAALRDDEQAIIRTIHGYGYRLVATVRVEAAAEAVAPQFAFKPGDPVPGRAQWRLERHLGAGGHGEAWLGCHEKTREMRVFKFALEPRHLTSLKREITLYRLLSDLLGEAAPIVRILEWNVETAPYFLESEHVSGGNLGEWALALGGLAALSLDARLELAAQIAEAIAQCHSVGVLHKDLKPSNLLVDGDAHRPRVKLGDFGSGSVLNPDQLEQLGITRLGFTKTVGPGLATSGTPFYLAPEVLSGQPFTVQADVYAAGILLYQLAVADFKRPLAAGWERDVTDEILREDISAACEGTPALRLADAGELARRIRSLAQRRDDRARERAAAEAARRHEADVEKQRKIVDQLRSRRRWTLALASTLGLGLAVSSGLYLFARHAQAQSEKAAAATQAVVDFLTRDLLTAGDDTGAVKPDLTVKQALDAASDKINRRFGSENPQIAAQVHMAVAWAYDAIGDTAAKAREFELASQLKVQGQGPVRDWDVALMMAKLAMSHGPPSDSLCDDFDAVLRRGVEGNDLPSLKQHLRVIAVMCDPAGPLSDRSLAEVRQVESEALSAQPPDLDLAMSAEEVLAALSYYQGDFERAEQYKRLDIEHAVAQYGENDHSVLERQTTLVTLLSERGRVDEAETLFGSLHSRARDSVAQDIVGGALTRLCFEEGRLDEARASLAAKLETSAKDPVAPREKYYEELFLAEVRLRQGGATDALAQVREAREALERLGAPSRINALEARNEDFYGTVLWAEALRQAGDLAKARTAIEAARRRLGSLPARHPLIAEFKRVEGLLLSAEHRTRDAAAALQEAVDLDELRYGVGHWRTQRARSDLAQLNRGGG